jgi:hypothetical protein
MILDDQPVSLRVEAGEGATTSEQAVSMGLITTELVLNSLKHAFPGGASRLLKKSFVSTGKDGVVVLSKDSSTSIVPSSSSSADPSPEISSQSGVDHPLPADQLAFYRDAHVDVASSLGARTRL